MNTTKKLVKKFQLFSCVTVFDSSDMQIEQKPLKTSQRLMRILKMLCYVNSRRRSQGKKVGFNTLRERERGVMYFSFWKEIFEMY